MANPEHVEIAKAGKGAIDAWRREHPKDRLELSRADLRGIDLFAADFSGANLRKANLSEANLGRGDLRWADLRWADLHWANLRRADLRRADLHLADLRGANLSWANLSWANLGGAKLSGAFLNYAMVREIDNSETNFDSVYLGGTVFADCDLTGAMNLDRVRHGIPSTIGIDTILRSGGNIPEEFLRGAGVPEEIIRGLPMLIGEIKYHSCFIGYGEPDREFAERLHKDLTGNKLSCWVYSMDYTPGEHTQREIKETRQRAGKFVVLCSAAGLLKDGVLKEIEDQMDEDRDKIVPISLDKVWKADGFPVKRGARDLKPFLLERNYANFEESSDYKKELNRLLKALDRRQG
ncbi:MAG: toll/interleukin-1 receptor domain-containing protein [Chloroflexi bacterium]|nr:toll/interleukin-1 receptor domain-containing protein [Chloroflexota bacterium]MCZ6867514.1 toll/interleukin-1 receptor domain-containing protein [Chloroflexota bacterium]